MLRVGIDGRDLLRKRTGVVNNTLHLARELTAAHPSEVIVYTDRPARPTSLRRPECRCAAWTRHRWSGNTWRCRSPWPGIG